MNGNPFPNPNDWTALWGDAQQKYWQSWMDLSRQMGAAGKPEPPANPWAQGLDTWAKLLAGAMPTETQDWVSKLTDLNKGYLQIGENFWKLLSANRPSTPEAWQEAVTRGFKQMQEGFGANLGAAKDPWAGFATFWGMPMDNWRRVYSACSTLPGDMEKALRGFAVPGETPESAMNRLISMPSLGYTREWQEELQQWQQRWLEHGQALRAYGQVLSGIAARAVEMLGKKLYALALESKTPETLREFYNLWVDAGEEAYADAAMSAEFTRAQAGLVNTLMAVKRQEQRMVDEVLSGLNMPTRQELDTSHARVHRLQRQVWRLQETLDESGIRSLREEVVALQREVEVLTGQDSHPEAERKPHGRRARATSES